jgi:NAD(P)-dependent dehydrogenase (short-subunit alcohol dehydrogenase family)
VATPADIAAAVLFLAGNGAAAITGQTLCIDAGYLLS